ncbi:MAG: hypothetical protein HY296_04325 [Thaumarchaeota archaeon]|nr:hypothetical protein [Nitrososphaerota archaeon]
MRPKNAVITLAVLAVIGVAGFVSYTLVTSPKGRSSLSTTGSCVPTGVAEVTESAPAVVVSGTNRSTSKTNLTEFGAVREYALPGPMRWANGITTAPDGSVWFGEESVPGVGHLDRNGTLVEYPWPNPAAYSGDPGNYKTGIWGIVIWEGKVWATDMERNQLVGVDPLTGGVERVNLTGMADSPYTLTASPGGDLWFTSLSNPGRIGRLNPGLGLSVFTFRHLCGQEPLQLDFVNSTSGFFVALDPLSPSGAGGLFRFDVSEGPTGMVANQVGGEFSLYDPDSVSVSGDVAWVVQHGPSNILSYSLSSGSWSVWPTSTVRYTNFTLPYFVEAVGGKAWFNEHYGNKIGVIDPATRKLTEYGEGDPASVNQTLVQNDLTIATGQGGLWFTSITGNYIGFVNSTVDTGFGVTPRGSRTATLTPGFQAIFQVAVSRTMPKELRVEVSDSELSTSVPKLISVAVNQTVILPPSVPAGSHFDDVILQVTVSADPALKPGQYVLAVTATDGSVYQTCYLDLDVG